MFSNYPAVFEQSTLVWIVLSTLGSLGSNTGYSVAIGCFVLYIALTSTSGVSRNDQHHARLVVTAGVLTSLCILVDVVYCSLHVGTLLQAGHEYSFAATMIFLSMAAKGLSLHCAYVISVDSGFTFGAIRYTSSGQNGYTAIGSRKPAHISSSSSSGIEGGNRAFGSATVAADDDDSELTEDYAVQNQQGNAGYQSVHV